MRSLSNTINDIPHTGNQRYAADFPKIPALAISTADAELLSQLLADQKDLKVYLESHGEMKTEKLSYNVIGEIRGIRGPFSENGFWGWIGGGAPVCRILSIPLVAPDEPCTQRPRGVSTIRRPSSGRANADFNHLEFPLNVRNCQFFVSVTQGAS